jgi:predicted CXXCH cytochrome family protein
MKYERDKNKMNKAEKFKEVGTMKKIFLTMLLVCVAVVFVTVDANAINGVCSGCHTMHDSQNNAAVASGGRQNNLLNAGCPTCHEGDGPGLELINGFGAPVILQVSDPGSPGAAKTLAAGDFWWVTQAEDATESPKGHNVIDLTAINGKDFNMPDTEPPGWDFSATNGVSINGVTIQVTAAGSWAGKQLTCSGQYGCHGGRTAEGFAGLTGAHHANEPGQGADGAGPSVPQGTVAGTADTMGNSYRFLLGIKGLEDDDWQWTETSVVHNEYFGDDDTAIERDDDGTTGYTNTDTISFFCAQCHGNFHSEIAASAIASPWRRHPTDIVLLAAGETSKYNTADGTNIGTYSLEAPIARGTAVPATSSDTVLANNSGSTGGIVMCLSCHRAHGSDQPDLLRWDYATMQVNGATSGGCFTCHNEKNAAGVNP